MIGLAPRISSLPQKNSQISAAVMEAAPDLPGIVADLISEYAEFDYWVATHNFKLDKEGNIIENEENNQIRRAIKEAFMSSECDVEIKKTIFKNIFQSGGSSSKRIEVLEAIFNDIRSSGARINLDNVDFSYIYLSGMNLSGASVIGANFRSATLQSIQLTGADLTGSSFRDAQIHEVMLTGAVLNNVTLKDTTIAHSDLSAVTAQHSAFTNVVFRVVTATGMQSNDETLMDIIKKCEFDRNQTTGIAAVDAVLEKGIPGHPYRQSSYVSILHGTYSSRGAHGMYKLNQGPNQWG